MAEPTITMTAASPTILAPTSSRAPGIESNFGHKIDWGDFGINGDWTPSVKAMSTSKMDRYGSFSIKF